MAGTPVIQESPVPRGSLWVVRVIALVFLLGLSVDFLATAWFYLRPCVESPLLKLPMMLPAIPYVMILVKLRARSRKRGLALAACWSGAVTLGLGMLFVDAATVRSITTLYRALLFVVCLLHALLFTAALTAFRNLPREVTDRRTFLLAFCGTPFLLLLAFTGMIDRNRPPHTRAYRNEVMAFISVREIRTASENYASYFGNGYPAGLAVLGPPDGKAASCVNAGLINEAPAKGERAGYTFDYRPGPTVGKPPSDCPPGVQTYTVSARPREFERSGCRSFFLDEAAVIHYTNENRAATAADPALEW